MAAVTLVGTVDRVGTVVAAVTLDISRDISYGSDSCGCGEISKGLNIPLLV